MGTIANDHLGELNNPLRSIIPLTKDYRGASM